MKRHESLAPLSREHHDALILAQLLKKDVPAYRDMPTGTTDKIIYAMKMFNDSLKQHFQKEELLLEKVQHCHEDIKKLGDEIIAEHQQLAASFLNLDKVTNSEDSMDSLGIALDMHIRKEERVLFPLMEKYCSEEVLNEVGLLLQ